MAGEAKHMEPLAVELAPEGGERTTYKDMVKPTPADISCFVNLFMNNLSTIITTAILGNMVLAGPFGVGFDASTAPPEIREYVRFTVFGKIIPGMLPTLLLGSIYYSWMAVRILQGKPAGTKMTALPYGINTPAALLYIFKIIGPACAEYALLAKNDDGSWDIDKAKEAIDKGVGEGIAANLVGGCISMLFAAFGPALVKRTPPPALMIALAGIGLTWLGYSPVLDCSAFAGVGVLMMVLSLLLQLNIVKTGRMPPAVLLLLTGSTLGWLGGAMSWDAMVDAASFGFYIPQPADAKVFDLLGTVIQSKIGLIIPVAFTGAIGTLLVVKAAEIEGDAYPMAETLVVDGFTTCISALFGSPYATCVFIGHPQFKQMGGGVSYGVYFGMFYAFLATIGGMSVISAVVPPFAVMPIILFIGVMIVSDSFATTPKRHFPACVMGLFPAVADFVKSNYTPSGPVDGKWYGTLALANGALMSAILWTSIIVCLIDSHFVAAGVWSAGGALMSAIGLIHSEAVDLTFQNFFGVEQNPITGPEGFRGTRAVDFTVGYAFAAVLFFGLAYVQAHYPHLKLVDAPHADITEGEGQPSETNGAFFAEDEKNLRKIKTFESLVAGNPAELDRNHSL